MDLLRKVSFLACSGKAGEATALTDRVLGQGADAETREYILARIDYCRGDAQAFAQRVASQGFVSRFEGALSLGQIDRAVQIKAEAEKAGKPLAATDSNLMLAIAARAAGDAALAETSLKGAIAALRTGDRQDRIMAGWLAGDAEPKPGEPTLLPMHHQTKVLLLIALAERSSECRDECVALARKLNFEPAFPHLLLANALAK